MLRSTSSLYCEALESRQLLSVNDLVISVFDDTAGQTVLRYETDTYTPTAGGVATGNNGLAVGQGLVVAPDGLSFYVSSAFSGQVLHYDMDGNFLDVLGASDAEPAPLQTPATLLFGPDGHLYVADLGSFGQFPGGLAIYEYDTSSNTQQYQEAGTYELGFAPGGFTFVEDGEDFDLVVGDLFTQSVHRYEDPTTFSTTLIGPFSGINPASILARPNGDLLIGDIDLGAEPFGHHRVVLYDGVNPPSTFIDFTTPVGTGGSAGWAPQPSTMLYDTDGNLLIGVSPDHNLNGAIFKYDFVTEDLDMLVSGIGSPTGLGLIPNESTVVTRNLFYNQSVFDGGNDGIDSNDDSAIAPDKIAYRPGDGVATFANVSSYSRGINGIMIDLRGPGNHAAINVNDFVFKVGNNNSPSLWASAPAPSAISIRSGAGISGSDRVEITWSTGDIRNAWLEVQVLSTSNTGLGATDVFFWGSRVADSGTSPSAGTFDTTSTDAAQVFATLGASKPISDLRDYNRDGAITTTDASIVFASLGTTVRLDIGTAGPFAPQSGDAGIASALASTSPKFPASVPSDSLIFPENVVPASPALIAVTGLLAEDPEDAEDAFSISTADVDEEVLEALASLP
jgi:hypothetical protein